MKGARDSFRVCCAVAPGGFNEANSLGPSDPAAVIKEPAPFCYANEVNGIVGLLCRNYFLTKTVFFSYNHLCSEQMLAQTVLKEASLFQFGVSRCMWV